MHRLIPLILSLSLLTAACGGAAPPSRPVNVPEPVQPAPPVQTTPAPPTKPAYQPPSGLFAAGVTDYSTFGEVVLINLNKQPALEKPSKSKRARSPVLSPDHAHLYFIHQNEDETHELRVVALGNGTERTLLKAQHLTTPALSPDHKWLAITGDDKLFAIELLTGRLTTVIEKGVTGSAFFGPDGRSLLYELKEPLAGLYRATAPDWKSYLIKAGAHSYGLHWLGPDRFALSDGNNNSSIITIDGKEVGHFTGFPLASARDGSWLLVDQKGSKTLFLRPASRQMVDLSSPQPVGAIFPWGASPQGQFLLYSKGANGAYDLHVWNSASPWSNPHPKLLTVRSHYGILAWQSETTGILRGDKKLWWFDLKVPAVTEIMPIPDGLTPEGGLPAATEQMQKARAEKFYAWEQRALAAVQKVITDPATVKKSRDQLAKELDLPGLRLAEFPQQRIRIWTLGPFAEPSGGTLRWQHNWVQAWEPDGKVHALKGARFGLSQWRAVTLGDQRIVVGAGLNMNDPHLAGAAVAYRIKPGAPPEPAPDLFAAVPAKLSDRFTSAPSEAGKSFALATGPGGKDTPQVRFAQPGGMDLAVCNRDDRCLTLNWTEKGYTHPN